MKIQIRKKKVTKVNLHRLIKKFECFIAIFYFLFIFHLCKPNSTNLHYLLWQWSSNRCECCTNYALCNLLDGSNRCIKPNNKMKELINLILQNQWNNWIEKTCGCRPFFYCKNLYEEEMNNPLRKKWKNNQQKKA